MGVSAPFIVQFSKQRLLGLGEVGITPTNTVSARRKDVRRREPLSCHHREANSLTLAAVAPWFPLVTLIDREPLQEIPDETLGGAAGAESFRHIENTRGRAK